MKKFICWFLAVVITVSAAIYQRMTGPTYPKRVDITVNNNINKVKLVRSLGLEEVPAVKLAIDDGSVNARLFYKRLNTADPYTAVDFEYEEGKGFTALVPQQPPAGKLQYWIEINDDSGSKRLFEDEPVVIRFKGAVPAGILTPHVILMFFAMLLSTLAGLMAVMGLHQQKRYGILSLLLLIAGGMVLGPIVQYYAFGEFWTGVPFGWDLTDNKTLLALLFWILAVGMNYRRPRPVYTVIAAVVLLLVYSIPHSMFGSELDYASGTIKQGMILNIFF